MNDDAIAYPRDLRGYSIRRCIGVGGYGKVYEASVLRTGELVAIKDLEKRKVFETPGLEARVRAEAQLHSLMNHPAIVKMHTFFEDSLHVYFVLELCPFGDLKKWLSSSVLSSSMRTTATTTTPLLPPPSGSNGTCSDTEARLIVKQVASALAYLHETLRVIHRDIKLSNILISKIQPLTVKLCDFGLAVQATDDDNIAGADRTLCGTPSYISPECLLRKPHGFERDAWALGVVLCALLTRETPFSNAAAVSGGRVDAALEKMKRGVISLPKSLNERGSLAKDLVERLLSYEPERRPSARAVGRHPFITGPTAPITGVAKLPAIRHETRSGSIEITPRGDVVVRLGVGEEMVIGVGGTACTVSGVPIAWNELPPRWASAYSYAAHFIHIVRSRTSRVTIVTDRCKAILMESREDFVV